MKRKLIQYTGLVKRRKTCDFCFFIIKSGWIGRMLRQHAGDENDRIALMEQVWRRESEGEESERR
jgi:hypothetical protein